MGSSCWWCGNSSKTGAKVVALLDLSLAILHFGFGLAQILLPQLFTVEDGTVYYFTDLPDSWSYKTDLTVTILVRIFVLLAELSLIWLLTSSIKENNTNKCNLWIKIRLVLLIIGVFGYSCEIAWSNLAHKYFLWSIILGLAVIYRTYTIIIVRSFYLDLVKQTSYDFTFLDST